MEIKNILVMETIKAGKSVFIRFPENEIVNKYWKLKTLEGYPVAMAINHEI